MNKTQEKVASLHADITATIIEQIKLAQVTGTWQMPWHNGADTWDASNPVTGLRYTAGNRLILGIIGAMTPGYGQHWATYKQWRSLTVHEDACALATNGHGSKQTCEQHGCEQVHVTKGETGMMALRPKMRKIREDDGTERMRLTGWIPYTVFNSSQVTGYEEPAPVRVTIDGDAYTQMTAADVYAERIGAKVIHDAYLGGACYQPSSDLISMPTYNRWTEPDRYWGSLVHEMIHWTGHPDRLDRNLSTDFGSEAYAKEELVAELGAAFHLAHLGMHATPREDHTQYLAAWLKILEADPEVLWKAAGKAELASKDLGRRFEIATIPEGAV